MSSRFSAAKSTVSRAVRLRECPLGELPVYNYLCVRNWRYHFSRQTFKFNEFLLQMSSTVISSSQKLYKTFWKKHLLLSQVKKPYGLVFRYQIKLSYCQFDPTVLFQAEWNLLPQPIAIIFDIPRQEIKTLAHFHFCSSLLLKMASARDQKNFLDQLMATMGILPSLETEKVSSLRTKSIYLNYYYYYYYCFCYCYYYYYFRTCTRIVWIQTLN